MGIEIHPHKGESGMLERWIGRLSALYLLAVAVVIGYGLLAFGGEVDGRSIETLWHQAPPAVRAWQEAYGRYLYVTPILLGLMMGVWAGLLGRWWARGVLRSLAYGLGALLAGWVLTALPFVLLPRYHFPGGDFAPSLLWLAGAAYPALGGWLLTTLIGSALMRYLTAKGASPWDS